MPVRVEVRDGESVRDALKRFRTQVHLAYRRPVTKRRPGFYEKPSAVRRTQEWWRVRNAREMERCRGGTFKVTLKVYGRWQSLWDRGTKVQSVFGYYLLSELGVVWVDTPG